MRVGDLFETKVEEKIDPVIKVGETADEHKLASEIGSYVVTPLIEKYLNDFFEHYTDSFQKQTTEIGAWISGYFGSGKSHLAKIMALVVENRKLAGVNSSERFLARIPVGSPQHGAIKRSLARMPQCEANVLAFNINTLSDSRTRSLPSLLLSQYYLSQGYGNNLIYARVIEAELDRQGKLKDLHQAVEARAKRTWKDIQQNLSFYSRHLYDAACEVAPEVFETPQAVERALKEAEKGELYNARFLVDTILEGLQRDEKEKKKPQRVLLVLDESGQWIENDYSRLAQLQALIEEAAVRGQGRIWVIVTTHGDMGSIYKEARALEGDMKKIEGRFRFKFGLTTENIELVLEDRLFKKTLSGKQHLDQLYSNRGGMLRGIGELANTSQTLPPCSQDKFPTYYPFFPYQVHLIPEIVKTLRSKGGRGEQLSGSTRTLLAITQDILRAGRRKYLDEGVGILVSFDEIYDNLSGEGEISPDVRTELSRLKGVVPGATDLTPRVAEVLYLIREIPYISRTKDNIARLLAERVEEDLPTVIARIEPELERLIKAKLVARIGDEYEFLTGERRTFEDEVGTIENQLKHPDRERGLNEKFVYSDGKAHWRKWFDFDTVPYIGAEFPFRLQIDSTSVQGRQGDITLKFSTPLAVLGPTSLADVESQSLRSDEQYSIFFFSGRIPNFDRDLARYLAMKEVIDNWKGDTHRSEEARNLAMERESNDLPKLERKVLDGFKEGIRTGWTIFRGTSRSLAVKSGQKPSDALRAEMAVFWPLLYPKFDKVPFRVANEQRAIQDVLDGNPNPIKDVTQLKIFDKAGKIDPNCPLLDSLRIHLATEQNSGRRVLGKDILGTFSAPPYGWDSNAVRVGVAALVRSGAVKILINKKAYTNPADRDLIDALRVSRNFDRVELILEVTEVSPEVLTETRSFLMNLTKRRGIDETPTALSEVAGAFGEDVLKKADTVRLWAEGSGLPLPNSFVDGEDIWRRIKNLSNPIHRVQEIHVNKELLESGSRAVEQYFSFQKENRNQFLELEQFATQVLAIEHNLDPGSTIAKFLEAHRTTVETKNFADKETWKQLQALKAQSALELQALIEEWRSRARRRIDENLERLPEELKKRGLDPALADEISAPLHSFRESLNSVTVPAKAAALPQQADTSIRNLGERIISEAAKKKAPPTTDDHEPPKPRTVKRLSFNEISTVTRLTNEEEWDDIKEKMDSKVRSLLKQGFDVELA